jgi:hypothetical protein
LNCICSLQDIKVIPILPLGRAFKMRY